MTKRAHMPGKSNDTTPRDGERIAKVMARAGLASRREAEAWITAGRVAVNGAVISSPAINVTGRRIASPSTASRCRRASARGCFSFTSRAAW